MANLAFCMLYPQNSERDVRVRFSEVTKSKIQFCDTAFIKCKSQVEQYKRVCIDKQTNDTRY